VLTVLAILGVLVVLFGAAVLATREGEVLRDAPPDAADLVLPAGSLRAEDVRQVRFGLAFRGYRMSEVDALLDRVATQLGEEPAEELVVQAPDEDDAEKSVPQPVVAAPAPANPPEVFVPSEPPLESPPVHPRAVDITLPSAPVEAAPPVEVAQAPVEIAPLPAGEPSEPPRD
jgi:DivIVA domain-containing protein